MLLVCGPLLAAPGAAQIKNIKLSEGVVGGFSASWPYTFLISPDNSRALYWGRWNSYNYELFSVPLEGGTPTRLNAPLGVNQDVFGNFLISPDSSQVVYRADQDTEGVMELYRVPLDGSAAPVKVNGPLVNGRGGQVRNDFRISPDGSRVVYSAAQETEWVYELYSVPLDGSADPVKLNAALAPGGNVREILISPDSSRVVYWADQDTAGVFELYSVPLDGSAAPVKLNAPLVSGGIVGDVFQISPDSSRVVYLADQDTDNVWELFSVPLAGGASIKLNGSLVAGGNVGGPFGQGQHYAFEISPDSSWVAYNADQDTDGMFELYSVSLTGGGPIKLNNPLVLGGDVFDDFEISPDSSRVVYRADQDTDGINELYSVPVEGNSAAWEMYYEKIEQIDALNEQLAALDPADLNFENDKQHLEAEIVNLVAEADALLAEAENPATKLNGPLVSGGEVRAYYSGMSPRVSRDSSRVVYVADQDRDEVWELFSVPLDGGAVPVKLSGPLVGGGDVGGGGRLFQTSPDSRHVVYTADQDTDEVYELYWSPLDGSAAPTKLNGPLVEGGDVKVPVNAQPFNNFEISPNSLTVVYRADQDTNDVFELYATTVFTDIVGDDMDGNLEPGPGDVVLITDGATISGNLDADGATVIVEGGSTIEGNLDATNGATITIRDGSSVSGDVNADGGSVTVNDSTVGGNVEGTAGATIVVTDSTVNGGVITTDCESVTVGNNVIGGSIESTDDAAVTVSDNHVNGNIEIKDSTSCYESGNAVDGTNSGCP
jgi:hypothetical protein